MSRPLTAAGRAHLKKRMMKLPEQMRVRVDASLSGSADALVDAIKAAAPVRSGDLRDSIRKVPLEDGQIGYRIVGGERGKGKKGWYLRFVEYGTKASPGSQGALYKRQKGKWRGMRRRDKRAHAATPAQPFFWPTYRRMKARIRAARTRALKRGAQEAK
ncbi:HK97-gp10 family putative phage morphogenesis protein [Brevundimonas naejangsanensis]|uniref:HK97-gp10 family putative phage morphogenesis protein n=1 Tax=Brevundimonas naejangsanensis TaxID=588932 RepID=UPI003D082F4E